MIPYCMSVTLLHPAKATGQNGELLFGKDTGMVPTNTVLDRDPGPPREGDLGYRNPQFTAIPPIAELLWPLLLLLLLSIY